MRIGEMYQSFFGRQWSFARGGLVVGRGKTIYFLRLRIVILATIGQTKCFQKWNIDSGCFRNKVSQFII